MDNDIDKKTSPGGDDRTISRTQPVTSRRRYPDAPLIGVAAAVIDGQGRALLVKRGRPPRAGTWALPGGLLDLGERLVDGARREVREETGVDIEVKDVVGIFEPIQLDSQGRVEYHYVVIDFWARYLHGEARAHDDAEAVAWVRHNELGHYRLSKDTREVVDSAFAAWASEERGQ